MRITAATQRSLRLYRQGMMEALEPRRLLSVTATVLLKAHSTDSFAPTDLISDAAGNVYGTEVVPTPNSDGPEPTSGYGNIFEIAAKTHVQTTLYQFTGSNGSNPGGLVLDSAGNLYGQAASESGNLFDFEIAAGTHAFSTVTSIPTATFDDTARVEGDFNSTPTDAVGNEYSFADPDYHSPGSVIERDASTGVASTVARFPLDDGDAGYTYGNLIVDNAGNIFGTSEVSSDEAADNQTTVFEIHAGKHNISTLAIVPATSILNEVDGLVLDAAGNLYGVSTFSGPDSGYLFKVAVGTHAFTDLVNFSGIEAYPNPNPAIDAHGNLYFTTAGLPTSAGAFIEVSGTGFVVATDPNITYTAPSAQTALAGGAATPINLGSFIDASEPGPFTVNVNWGDGSADSNFTVASAGIIAPQNHSFLKEGNSTVTVTVYSAVGAGIEKATFPVGAWPTHLVFAHQPGNTVLGKALRPAVVVDVEDGTDHLLKTDDSAVSIVVASGPGSIAKKSVVSVDAVDGVATFSDLLLSQTGRYVLQASESKADDADSQAFNIKPIAVTPAIAAAQSIVVPQSLTMAGGDYSSDEILNEQTDGYPLLLDS